MKVSELIEELRKLMVKHGDVHVIKGDYGVPDDDEWVAEVIYLHDGDGEFDSEFLQLRRASSELAKSVTCFLRQLEETDIL